MRHRSPEQGASLVIVLAMISIFGLVVTALAAGAQVGVKSNSGVQTERVDQYAASGAIDSAISYLRGNLTYGREGLACPPVTLDSAAGLVSVDCTPASGSGAPLPSPNAPSYALLTTAGLPGGYPSGAGITITKNNTFNVNGPVYSNSSIGVTRHGRGVERGDGLRRVQRDHHRHPLACNTNTFLDDPGGAFGVDPVAPSTWASLITLLPATAPAPTCAANKVATMVPGSYFDLDAMTAGFGSCTVIWMQPGSYYFDWGVADASNTQWSIVDTVIGGTPAGWNPASGSTPAVTAPGACDTNAAGVHLVFATTSRLDIGGKATVELCGPVSATSQRIALYGRKSNVPGTLQSPPAYKPTAAGTSNPAGLTNPFTNVAQINGTSNTVTISGKKAVGTAALTGYGLSAIPAGSTLNSVQVKVAHSDSSALTDKVTVAAGSTTLCNAHRRAEPHRDADRHRHVPGQPAVARPRGRHRDLDLDPAELEREHERRARRHRAARHVHAARPPGADAGNGARQHVCRWREQGSDLRAGHGVRAVCVDQPGLQEQQRSGLQPWRGDQQLHRDQRAAVADVLRLQPAGPRPLRRSGGGARRDQRRHPGPSGRR